MNISENKRVVGLSAVFALAFAGTIYYGYGEYSKYGETQQKLTEIGNQFEDYRSEDVPPTAKNNEELKAAFGQVTKVNTDLQAELNRYANFCNGDGKNISGPALQEELKNAIKAVEQLAAEHGSKLSGSASELGMSSILRGFPEESSVPYYAFQHRAVRRVVEDIIKAGAPAVDKVYCTPLPDEANQAAKKSSKAVASFPLRFEISFEATRGVLPQVLNSIKDDKDFMLTITGLSVQGVETLAPMDAYAAPAAAASVGDELTAAPAEGEAPAARVVAVRKTGDPAEKARVYMTLQVLYFNPAKNK